MNTRELDEAMRLEALERQQITGTPEDENFDWLVRLACAATEMPIGMISLIDSARQWFKARIGERAREMPRARALTQLSQKSPMFGTARLPNRKRAVSEYRT